MSWSFSATGTPEKVLAHLNESIKRYGDPAKSLSAFEFQMAGTHIAGLVCQVKGPDRLVKVEAHGSASAKQNADGTFDISECGCKVSVETLYGTLI